MEKVLERIKHIDTTKNPTMQDLADIMIMLSMRSAEVKTLQIFHYEPESQNLPEWYKEGHFWYYTGYVKNRREKKENPSPQPFLSMEKNLEHARNLLTWIQDAINAGRLYDPVFRKSGKRNTKSFSNFLRPYKILLKELRDIGAKHASRIHGGLNSTPQYLSLLTRIALRQESERLNAGINYAMGETDSEGSDPDSSSDEDSEAKAAENEITEIIDIYSY
ncbi:hypothetical protein C1646_665702 [Rhizophagus diaphanus]|nr:hypothetical protein C1646_665702 [Rhizophagus diaphanus] [Rhizophagus sp. MUCL 43196]